MAETVVKFTPLPGWPCPACGGGGHMMDGSATFGPDKYHYTLPTPCSVCQGKGRVLVSPIPDQLAQELQHRSETIIEQVRRLEEAKRVSPETMRLEINV